MVYRTLLLDWRAWMREVFKRLIEAVHESNKHENAVTLFQHCVGESTMHGNQKAYMWEREELWGHLSQLGLYKCAWLHCLFFNICNCYMPLNFGISTHNWFYSTLYYKRKVSFLCDLSWWWKSTKLCANSVSVFWDFVLTCICKILHVIHMQYCVMLL